MSGLFAALSSAVAWLASVIDPLCGPIGIFRLFGSGTLLACDNAGWGDEISYGFMITATLAIAVSADVLVAGTATFQGGPGKYAANIAALRG